MNRKIVSLFLLIFLLAGLSLAAMAEETFEYKSEPVWYGEQLPYSSERLYLGYANRAIGKNLVTAFRSNRKSLNSYEQNMYDLILAMAQNVADGKRSSTEIEITAAEAGLTMEFSVKDLGLDLSKANEEQIENAVNERVQSYFDPARVIHACVRDNPFDFYWLSNQESTQFQYGFGGWMSLNGTGTTIRYEYILYFGFCVDILYRSTADDFFTTDTDKTGRVTTAVENAAAIVEAAADKNDLDRLTYYMQEIRKLSEYEYAVLEEYEGDSSPWQLINVFDGDADTKVVCEGYSKAFLYLCDMSTFEDRSLSVYCVSGMFVDSAGGGPHMWNIVSKSNGNYMVDITNCLTDGSIKDSLFLSTPYSGNVEDGYVFCVRPDGYEDMYVQYVYMDNILPVEYLTLTDETYQDPERSTVELTLLPGEKVALWSEALGLSNALEENETEADVCWIEGDSAECEENGILTTLKEGQTKFELYTKLSIITLNVDVTQIDTLCIPENIGIINEEAFSGTAAQRIEVSDKLVNLDASAFRNMTHLQQVVVPSGFPEAMLESLPVGNGIIWLCCDDTSAGYAVENDIPYYIFIR